MLAHSQMVTSLEFLKGFIKSFRSSDDNVKQFRILNILKKWIDLSPKQFRDPTSELGKEIRSFGVFLTESKSPLSTFLQTALDPSEEVRNNEAIPNPKLVAPPIINLKKTKKKPKQPSLLQYDPEEIARQLTLLDHTHLQKIDRQEFLHTKWVTSLTSYSTNLAPTLTQYTHMANLRAYWLSFQILNEPVLKYRIKILDQIIRVGMFLIKIKNYQSLMVIYLSLSFKTISRLSTTWKGLKPKTFTIWKKICSLMNPKDNFKNYREVTKTAEAPYIPCQEILLKDLLYHEESVPNFLTEEKIWNMKKLYLIGKLIDQFRRCQEQPFIFNPLLDLQIFLSDISEIPEEKLEFLTHQIEPSVSTSGDSVTRRKKHKKTKSEREETENDISISVEQSMGSSVREVSGSRNKSGSLSRSSSNSSSRTRGGSFNSKMRRRGSFDSITIMDGKKTTKVPFQSDIKVKRLIKTPSERSNVPDGDGDQTISVSMSHSNIDNCDSSREYDIVIIDEKKKSKTNLN
uniref:Ras-GEF domain-containing protein n=1 Tax=Arcella intermedia TaxID=1963864 RepID=A0A6B2L1J8_9EUKA